MLFNGNINVTLNSNKSYGAMVVDRKHIWGIIKNEKELHGIQKREPSIICETFENDNILGHKMYEELYLANFAPGKCMTLPMKMNLF